MRLLFISFLILNLLFSAWSLQKLLSGSGDLQHGVWIVICLATAVVCVLELRHQKMSSALGIPTLGKLENFLEELSSEEAPLEDSGQEEDLHCQNEPESEDLRQVA